MSPLAKALPLALLLAACGESCGRAPEAAPRGADAAPEPGPPADAAAVPDSGAPRSDGGDRPRAGGAGPDLVSPLPRPSRPEAPTFLGRPDEEIIAAMRAKRPVGARGTSGTSLSMYLNLEGDIDAAFKPRTKRGQRWAGEVAAYRLGRMLGIGRVPPAVSRRFRIATLRSLLEDEPAILARLEDEAVFDDNDEVVGALSYWVPVIHEAEVDREDRLERWTVWLQQGKAIPPDRLALARQLSDTITFDYVTGNWDRWSGGNVLIGPDERTLLVMDNNAAFNVRLSEGPLSHLEAPLSQVERWSAGLYRRLVALSAEDLRAELAEDPEGGELLSEAQVEALLRRRDRVVERIEGQVAAHGRDEVLCFP